MSGLYVINKWELIDGKRVDEVISDLLPLETLCNIDTLTCNNVERVFPVNKDYCLFTHGHKCHVTN